MRPIHAEGIDAAAAFRRYEEVRHRLVSASFPDQSAHASSLAEIADQFDGFVLDAFGVLNVGDSPVPGAVERIAKLRRMGKRLTVLTNGATQARSAALAKYHGLGFDFTADEVVASRDLAASALQAFPNTSLCAVASGPAPNLSDLHGLTLADLLGDDSLFDRADGFALFSSAGWTSVHQARLVSALGERRRPLLIANPDLVAPWEDGFSLEPGWFAHDIADRLGWTPDFHGKPFAAAFAEAHRRLGQHIPADRIGMVGDTLHTDVLGGAAAGFRTILVRDHGLFRGLSVDRFVAESGIVPDFIVPTT